MGRADRGRGVLASPRAFSFGGKVMVETFLSLWVLLAPGPGQSPAVRAWPEDRPGAWPGDRPGFAHENNCGVLARGRDCLVSLENLAPRSRPRSTPARPGSTRCWLALSSPLPGMFITHPARSASPSTLRVLTSLPRVSRSSSRSGTAWSSFWRIFLAGRWSRLWVFRPSCMSAARWRGWADRSRGFAEIQPSSQHFRLMTAASLIGATAVLMVPSYFDTRFLLPLWPAVSVALGGPTARLVASLGFVPRMLAGAGLAASVSISAIGLAREHVAPTHWSAARLIDRLVSRHGVSSLANVGNIETWNVCKTGLINELRSNPADCFVLHDLSAESREGLGTRLPRFDAVDRARAVGVSRRGLSRPRRG